MDIDKLIHDLRARINPQYYDQLGTESYERHQVVKALEYLRQENDRLKADAERIEWQPIETAPKDGTDILVMTGETMHVVRWINIHGDFDYWTVDDRYFYKTGDDFDFDFESGCFLEHLTHWMPLPPEPAP